MSAGTLTLTNNTDAVTGTGTTFTSELVAGDFIVAKAGGITYTLPVKTVGSDTQAVLVSKYPGPTLAGIAWQAVPRESQNQVTAELVAQTTAALRGLNYDKQNWQAVFSASGDITVMLPDGSTFSGPSWKSIIDILNNIDIDAVQLLADQVRADALQVGIDKQAAEAAANSASTDANAAASANNSAQTAKQDSETAAGTATSKASEAVASAQEAAAAQAAAEQAAATVQPENLLQNANNLDDLTDKSAARQNLDVFSREEIADMLPGFLGQIDWQEMRTALEPGTAPRDGQEVDQTGIFADLYAKALAGKLPTCTEAEWQADPLNRGCYVLESSPGKMRLPDDNGVQPGSLKVPVKVGDGGDATTAGTMGGSELPNLKHTTKGYAILGLLSENSDPDALIQVKRGTINNYGSAVAGAAYGADMDIDASRYNPIYKDGVTEVRTNRQHGCWTVRYAAKATNGGSIDALALATAIAAGDAELLAKIIATNARIDYALISPETNPALGSRTVFENPFGNNTPVICVCEIFHVTLQKWTTTPWIYSSPNSYGMISSYSQGEGIVMTCGKAAFVTISLNCGASQEFTTNYTTVSPVRIHVWKITE